MSDSLSVCVTRALPRAKYDNWVCVHNFLPTDSEEEIRESLALARPRASADTVAQAAKELVKALADNPGFIARLYDGASIVLVFSPAAVVIV